MWLETVRNVENELGGEVAGGYDKATGINLYKAVKGWDGNKERVRIISRNDHSQY